jgi:hypothetical protein
MDFTYPKYNNGWDVEIAENGNLVHKGSEYPYLFWDGKQNLSFARTNGNLDGWLVEKERVVSFLESKLSVYGLNDREITDFITYWAPRMIQYDQVFVQLLIDDAYDEVAKLNMTPKPESSKRIYLKFADGKNLNQSDVSPQMLIEFNRKGLTYIEWGGSELSSDLLKTSFNVRSANVYIDGKSILEE